MEHVNVHEVLQVFCQCLSTQTCQLIGALNALRLPVRPVQFILVYSQAKGVGQLAANQNLDVKIHNLVRSPGSHNLGRFEEMAGTCK